MRIRPTRAARGAGLRPASYAVPQPWNWRAFLAGVYLLGACALLTRPGMGTVRTSRLASAALRCKVPTSGVAAAIAAGFEVLTRISHTWLGHVAHALVRAVSRLFSTPWPAGDTVLEPRVGTSAGAARTSACATSSRGSVCEKCGLDRPIRNSSAGSYGEP